MDNRLFWVEFIKMYQALPCLWKLNSRDYTNRIKKNKAYIRLVHKLKEIYPNANREMVVKKINVLRTNYRRELKKVMESTKSGTQEAYVPLLWYYNLMTFLDGQHRKETTNGAVIKTEIVGDINRLRDHDESSRRNTLDTPLKIPNKIEWRNKNNIAPQPKKRTILDEAHFSGAVEQLTSTRSSNDNNCDTIMLYWKTQYKELESKQKILCRKVIADVLFHASLGELDVTHVGKIQDILLQRTETLFTPDDNGQINASTASTPRSSMDIKEYTMDTSTRNMSQSMDNLDSVTHSSVEAKRRRTDNSINPLDITSSYEMKANIKLMIKLNWSSEQIMNALKEVYEDEAPSRKQVIQLVQQFEESDDDT